jgi:transcriptional regulator with XRE-family HTH domain
MGEAPVVHVRGGVRRELRGDLPPGRLRVAEVVDALLRTLVMPEGGGHVSLRQAAELLSQQLGVSVSKSVLSRYRSGERLPSSALLRALREVAVQHAGADVVAKVAGVSDAAELDRIYQGAESRTRPTAAELEAENDRLRREVEQLRVAAAGLEQALEVCTCRVAGQSGNPAPPVPVVEGDRRNVPVAEAADVAAANFIAGQALRLQGQPEDPAGAALLLDAASGLTPVECAAAVVLLRRQGTDELAETLILQSARQRTEHYVMSTAKQMLAWGMTEDAGVLLEAALSVVPGQVPAGSR